MVNMDIHSAVERLKASGLTAEVVGEGPLVVSQTPEAYSYVDSNTTVALEAGGITETEVGTEVVVPNLFDKRYSEVVSILEELGLILAPQGEGVAYKQSPARGEVVEAGSTVTVYFAEEETTVTTVAP